MTTPKKMTRKQEYDHYAKAENQTPKGPARRRKQNLTEMVPVRFEADVLDEVRRPPTPTTAPCPHGSGARVEQASAERRADSVGHVHGPSLPRRST